MAGARPSCCDRSVAAMAVRSVSEICLFGARLRTTATGSADSFTTYSSLLLLNDDAGLNCPLFGDAAKRLNLSDGWAPTLKPAAPDTNAMRAAIAARTVRVVTISPLCEELFGPRSAPCRSASRIPSQDGPLAATHSR